MHAVLEPLYRREAGRGRAPEARLAGRLDRRAAAS